MYVAEYAKARAQGPRKHMQDIVSVHETPYGASFFSVFDGYGPEGELVAVKAAQTVKDVARAERLYNQSSLGYARIVRSALRSLHLKHLRREKWARDSGTTATIAIFKRDLLAVTYLGDSEACFFPDKAPGINLTPAPHTADNDKEAARVRRQGYDINEQGYFGGQVLVSRALGNWQNAFIVHEGEITSQNIEEPGTVVVGSNGVWGNTPADHSRVETAVRQNGSNIYWLADQLVELSAARYRDNASVVLARIE